MAHPLIRWFHHAHLPESLRKVSVPFAVLAVELDDILSDGSEKTVALRKLLEAKDAAVRQRVADVGPAPGIHPPLDPDKPS